VFQEEHRLRAFKNRVLKKIFGPKWEEIAGVWRKWPSKDFHELYPYQILGGLRKSNSMR
jgi:hypothetical protein